MQLPARTCAGFSTDSAVALSNVTILSGACASFLFNVRRCQVHSKRPLIDWDLILIMEPTTIMGALLGSYLNKVGGMAGTMMSEWLVTNRQSWPSVKYCRYLQLIHTSCHTIKPQIIDG
jgi:uncharacterized membrane protein YfcA